MKFTLLVIVVLIVVVLGNSPNTNDPPRNRLPFINGNWFYRNNINISVGTLNINHNGGVTKLGTILTESTTATLPPMTTSNPPVNELDCNNNKPDDDFVSCPESGFLEITKSTKLIGYKDRGPSSCTYEIKLSPNLCNIYITPLSDLQNACKDGSSIAFISKGNKNVQFCPRKRYSSTSITVYDKKDGKIQVTGRLNYKVHLYLQCCEDDDFYVWYDNNDPEDQDDVFTL